MNVGYLRCTDNVSTFVAMTSRDMTSADSKRERRINLRVSQADKDVLNEAASSLGLPLSRFLLEAARDEASQVLANRSQFLLSETDWNAFVASIDAPVEPVDGLVDLMRRAEALV